MFYTHVQSMKISCKYTDIENCTVGDKLVPVYLTKDDREESFSTSFFSVIYAAMEDGR